jgi:hypothetical protein
MKRILSLLLTVAMLATLITVTVPVALATDVTFSLGGGGTYSPQAASFNIDVPITINSSVPVAGTGLDFTLTRDGGSAVGLALVSGFSLPANAVRFGGEDDGFTGLHNSFGLTSGMTASHPSGENTAPGGGILGTIRISVAPTTLAGTWRLNATVATTSNAAMDPLATSPPAEVVITIHTSTLIVEAPATGGNVARANSTPAALGGWTGGPVAAGTTVTSTHSGGTVVRVTAQATAGTHKITDWGISGAAGVAVINATTRDITMPAPSATSEVTFAPTFGALRGLNISHAPAGAASADEITAAGSTPAANNIAVDEEVEITSGARRYWTFANWTGLPTPSPNANTSPATFDMTAGAGALEATANWHPNVTIDSGARTTGAAAERTLITASGATKGPIENVEIGNGHLNGVGVAPTTVVALNAGNRRGFGGWKYTGSGSEPTATEGAWEDPDERVIRFNMPAGPVNVEIIWTGGSGGTDDDDWDLRPPTPPRTPVTDIGGRDMITLYTDKYVPLSEQIVSDGGATIFCESYAETHYWVNPKEFGIKIENGAALAFIEAGVDVATKTPTIVAKWDADAIANTLAEGEEDDDIYMWIEREDCIDRKDCLDDCEEDCEYDKDCADDCDEPVYTFRIQVGMGETAKLLSEIDGHITIAVPYELEEDQDPNCIVVYHLGTNEHIRSKYEPYAGSDINYVKFITNKFSRFQVVTKPPVEFTDKDATTAAMFEHITFAAVRGLFKGNLDKSFAPKGNITYREMAAVLANFNGQVFTDYPAQHLAWARSNGIFAGVDFSNERDAVTRADMALMIYNYIGFDETKVYVVRDWDFSDIADSDAADAIRALASWDIISGDTGDGGTFRPESNINRDEVAAIISKFVKAFIIGGYTGDVLPNGNGYDNGADDDDDCEDCGDDDCEYCKKEDDEEDEEDDE